MKKKIRDLTLNEVKKICYGKDTCSGCPLIEIKNKAFGCPYYDIAYYENKLDQEIEVEENE